MKLYLMQHALACSAEEDQERPLNAIGINQAKTAARGIKRLGLTFDLIVASPKRRSQQTAALIAEGIRYPYSDILKTESALPDRPPLELLNLLRGETSASSILVVGHMPQLAKVASHLLQGAELQIENAGLSCLELSDKLPARLLFHLQEQHLYR